MASSLRQRLSRFEDSLVFDFLLYSVGLGACSYFFLGGGLETALIRGVGFGAVMVLFHKGSGLLRHRRQVRH